MGTIGENIIYFRKKRHLSQCELAKLMGVSQNAVYGWENNKRKPSIDILKKMSEILRITLYDIVEGNKPIEKSTCNIFPGIKVPAIDGKMSIGDNINSHEITLHAVFNEIKKRAKEAETEEYEAREKGEYLDAIESRGVHIALIDILKDFGQDGG